MYNNVIKLISEISHIDEYGDSQVIETERIVFVDVRSIGMNEFYQSQALGLRPEIKFVMADYLDYQNEKKIKYAPLNSEEEIYSVIRTYRDDNTLELVCRRGINV